MFRRDFKLPSGSNIRTLRIVNHVMHVNMCFNPYALSERRMCGGLQKPREISHVSSSKSGSTFSQMKYPCKKPADGGLGVIMQFPINRSMTRLGGISPSDGFKAITQFIKWSEESFWWTNLKTLNIVVSGIFDKNISKSVESLPRAYYDEEVFKGVVLLIDDIRATATVFPQTKAGNSKINIAGVIAPDDLMECIEGVIDYTTTV